MELIEKLGIDWKILIFQIINFGILVFILTKFVYRPVLNMLEKRSKMIEKGVEDAKKSEALLKQIEEVRMTKFAETERKIGALLTQAKVDAETLKKKIIEEAARQAEDLVKRAKIQVEEEKEKMVEAAKQEVVKYAIRVAAKILEREFTEDHQKKLTDVIAHEMKSLS